MDKNFFIYNSTIYETEKENLSSIPMLVRRRFSNLTKCALSTLMQSFTQEKFNLLVASEYGEFDTLNKLIEQIKDFDEVSPTLFSNSVHNCVAGNFTQIMKINNSYNAVSSGKNTITNALAEAVSDNNTTLLCYADALDKKKSFSLLLGHEKKENSIKCQIVFEQNIIEQDEYAEFVNFLNSNQKVFRTPFYTIRRIDE